MTENTQNPSEVPYDAQQDSDADPDMLNPRAEGAQDGDVEGDPDADPGMLNPRAGGAGDAQSGAGTE
ncbi:hypothetical protein [uncultured Cellulomonas sp.]|uniref:hypothetical protein n=1 Tax=uncultured Cellulomonas sp. TaxID=189682 RepID=UPI00262D5744|nr:hypothetical protein [uncultured Cellulomonas sp.]